MNGTITFSYLLAGAATIFASYFIIARYKKKLTSLMSSGIGENITDEKTNTIAKSIQLRLIKDQNEGKGNAKSVEKRKWQTFTIYIVAYLAYVITYSVLDLVNTQTSLSFYRIVFVGLLISPPICLLYVHIFISDPNKEIKLLLKLFGISIIIITVWQFITSYKSPTFYEGIMLFGIYNALPILLIFLFRLKKIKSVSLTISIFSFLTLLITSLIINFFSRNDNALRSATDILFDTGLKGDSFKLSFFGLLIVVGLLIAWQALRIFKYFYNQHQITQLQLFADAYLLIFGIYHASISASEGNSAYIVYIVAFVAYKIVSIFLFRKNKENEDKITKLLYLRVFDLGEKSESLFKAIETEWRFAGPTQLITGPDLAHTTVEPHEIISYLAGNLKQSFSTSNEQVENNLKNIYMKPLFDNSYQTNEMFCDNIHWKTILNGLVKKTDVVLMDLRSFDKKYEGCIFEIRQLCYLFDLHKCVFVVDKNTNQTFLEETFKGCFAALPIDSPNAMGREVSVNLFELDTLENEKAKGLFQTLIGLVYN